MKHIGKSGAALAAAALTFALSGAATLAPAAAETAEVKCAGINSCKGHSECATANTSCKGQNGCKGQGWINAASKEECKAEGGKVIES